MVKGRGRGRGRGKFRVMVRGMVNTLKWMGWLAANHALILHRTSRALKPRWRCPSAFRHNLQCQLVRRVNFREECHWSHACKSFKRICVGSNGILECKFLSEMRTIQTIASLEQLCSQRAQGAGVQARLILSYPFSSLTSSQSPCPMVC
jgi:hypothetical protein